MRLVLDTHVLLWALGDPDELSGEARAAIVEPENLVAVSAASTWEISIKRALGKLKAPRDLVGALAASGFSALPITAEHTVAAGGLPARHRDPFDRMLVAQARIEGLVVVTRDPSFGLYRVDVLSA